MLPRNGKGAVKMKRYTILTLILLFTFGSIIVTAEDAPSGVAGTVVGINGNPIPDFSFALIPVSHFDHKGAAVSFLDEELEDVFGGLALMYLLDISPDKMPITFVSTDAAGAFSVNGIPPGFMQLWPLPHIEADTLAQWKQLIKNYINETEGMPVGILMNMAMIAAKPNKRIVSLQMGKSTVLQILDWYEDANMKTGQAFMIPSEKSITDMKIKVVQRLRVHARVLFADGTPVTNANIECQQVINGLVDNTFHIQSTTDADGYFTYYTDTPGVCRLSVVYDELTGGAESFQLDKNTPAPKNIVITLDGNKTADTSSIAPNVQLNLNPDFTLVIPNAAPFNRNFPMESLMVSAQQKETEKQEPQKDGVWVINPDNGHAYKKILCKDWHDAQQKAIEQSAHLVSINNAAEQAWVYSVFGQKKTPFWIGLNDVQKEGIWQWDSGEPATYIHWSDLKTVGEIPHSDAEKDYVVFTQHRFGSWQAVAPTHKKMTRYAVIEQSGLLSKIPETKKELDK